MIYREIPVAWDPALRQRFHTGWGEENVIVAARARDASYPDQAHPLSIRAVSCGEEQYFVDGRRLVVDEDTFLILNANRSYGSCVKAVRPVHSFSIFFRAGLLADVQRTQREPMDALLEDPLPDNDPTVEFSERIRLHDHSVSPVLRHIFMNISAGVSDDLWIDEQLQFLMQRMLKLHQRDLTQAQHISSVRASTRKELYRRVGLAVSFIHSNYRAAIDLKAIASASGMSRFHLLRTFKDVFGLTPSVYLNTQRTRVAARMLQTTSLTHSVVAQHVGFGARTTLCRHLREHCRAAPSETIGLESYEGSLRRWVRRVDGKRVAEGNRYPSRHQTTMSLSVASAR